ncbi:MAG TPA: CBS domain-containing protein [Solirubrobacteraceae bacterium]|nr:CBS domain-containing protein [Solirubrobacteraceae bacterium]
MPDITVPPYPNDYLMPPIDHATVGAAMHPGIFSCAPEASLVEVASTMTMHRVHCVAVMAVARDGSGERRVWGIISDLDLLRAGIRGGAGMTAFALAQEPVICVRDTTPLREAGETMAAHGVSHLVVVNAETQRPVGVPSTLDVAAMLAWDDA